LGIALALPATPKANTKLIIMPNPRRQGLLIRFMAITKAGTGLAVLVITRERKKGVQWIREVPTDTGQDDVLFETVAFEVDHADSRAAIRWLITYLHNDPPR